MTLANRMPAVGLHAKQKQRMMEIKGAARIRGGEGGRAEPHVWKRRRLQNFKLGKSQPLKENIFVFIWHGGNYSFAFTQNKKLMSLELLHPSRVSILWMEATDKKRHMNIWRGLCLEQHKEGRCLVDIVRVGKQEWASMHFLITCDYKTPRDNSDFCCFMPTVSRNGGE